VSIDNARRAAPVKRCAPDTTRGPKRRASRSAALALTVIGGLAGCAAPPTTALPPAPPAPLVAARDTTATLRPAMPAESPPRAVPVPPLMSTAALDAGTSLPALGPPRRAADGGVTWAPLASPAAESLRAAFVAARLTSDPDRVWIEAARVDPRIEPIALRRRVALALAAHDTAAADSALARLSVLRTPWQWEALRTYVDRVATRDPLRADALLEAADRRGWPDLERAAWLLRRARLRAELGDASFSIDLCRQLLRRYPAAAPAAQAMPLLEALLASREARPSVEDQEAAAEVAWARGDPAAATARLRSALRVAAPETSRIQVRLAEILRRGRQYDAAMNVLREAMPGARTAAESARVVLEEARVHRDAGRHEAAGARYSDAVRLALEPIGGEASVGDSATAEAALWEAAVDADRAGETSRARDLYREVVRHDGLRRHEAALRRGLLFLASGVRDSAVDAWRADTSSACRFWRGAVARRGDAATGDSLLRTVAILPGYGFYETAARESLGVRGWPGAVARDSCPADVSGEALALARDLVVIAETPGFVDAERARSDASLLVSRWTAGETLENGERAPRAPRALLAASRLAYAIGRLPAAIRFARDAAERSLSLPAAVQWSIAPWITPAAFDAVYAALPMVAEPGAPDRALVQALTWQESKFDPNARSRSNALGLMQLKIEAATDAARWLKEGRPTEAKLRDPATNFRYGVIYLERLLARFDGWKSVALAAYNAGPGRIPPAWRTWVAEGGDALAAELVPYPETRDYVKRILALRQAYRELTPSASSR
jgi:soluble lytic murein transglycosylase-like protein